MHSNTLQKVYAEFTRVYDLSYAIHFFDRFFQYQSCGIDPNIWVDMWPKFSWAIWTCGMRILWYYNSTKMTVVSTRLISVNTKQQLRYSSLVKRIPHCPHDTLHTWRSCGRAQCCSSSRSPPASTDSSQSQSDRSRAHTTKTAIRARASSVALARAKSNVAP